MGEAKKSDDPKPIAIDSDEREGNDVASLVGSGAPMVEVEAVAAMFGLQSGQRGRLLQTEELRLNIQNGNLKLVESK